MLFASPRDVRVEPLQEAAAATPDCGCAAQNRRILAVLEDVIAPEELILLPRPSTPPCSRNPGPARQHEHRGWCCSRHWVSVCQIHTPRKTRRCQHEWPRTTWCSVPRNWAHLRRCQALFVEASIIKSNAEKYPAGCAEIPNDGGNDRGI